MTAIQLPTDIAAAKRAEVLSQATAIEQARAVAEVAAAVRVAQDNPRDIDRALMEMHESTNQPALARRAFFEYQRAGSSIVGPSIHLARELARIWGNLDYGIKELRRDDDKHESEMLAFAWDQQTNTRPSLSFIVPHARDTKQGRKAIVDLRDIYENNTNQGARRVREMIFAVLPAYFVEAAQERCRETLAREVEADPRAADKAVAEYGKAGVTIEQLEVKWGKRSAWSAFTVADMGITFRSLVNREVARDEVFPPLEAKAVTVEDIQATREHVEPDADVSANDPAADQ